MAWWTAFFAVGLILLIGLIILIVWVIRKLFGGSGSNSKNTPLDIARERYARGEISRE